MEGTKSEKRGEGGADRAARRGYWVGQVDRWRGSGLTQREYCKREGISVERFGAWKRRLDREGRKEGGALVAVPRGIVSSALSLNNPALRLEVGERYRVEIPEGFSPATLEGVLRVLDRL